MATSNSDGSVKINTDLDPSGFQKGLSKLGSLAKTGLSVAAKSIAAVSAGLVAIGGAIVNSYADYEQLIGGIDTLFKDSSDEMQAYAANAYKTAGLSANAYMETVTSFSASLLQSLEGDTEKATSYADMAITDMADNANKMGTAMESIQDAYQGFAKQNYTMLDNLKLGYGGTKTEMERLLADAEKLSGIEYDISSFSDIVDAIHVVQTEMGITGTTALEAEKTISGSLSALKASFSNLAVGLGDADADVEELCQHVLGAFGTLVGNVEPIAENIAAVLPEALSAGIDAIEVLLPDLLSSVGDLITDALPELADAAVALAGALASGIVNNLDEISSAALSAVQVLVDVLLDALPELPAIAGEIIAELGAGLADYAPELIPAAVACIMELAQGLIDQLPMVLTVALQLIEGLADGIIAAVPVLIERLPALIQGIVDFLITGIPQIIEAVIYIVEAIAAQLPTIITALIDALPTIIESVVSGLVGCIGQLVAGAIQLVVLLVTHLPEIIAGLVAAIPQIVEALIAGFTESLPAFEEAGKTVMDALKTGVEEIWEKIKAFFTEAIPNLIDSIGEWFSELPGRVKQWLDDTLQKIQDWASNMDGKAEEAGEAFITAVVDFVKTLPGKVWTWLQNTISKVSSFVSDFSEKASEAGQEFFDNIVDKVREIPGEMLSIGGDIVSGIWDGIQSLSGWLWDQVSGFASGILNGVKSALGIHSPSRVMRDAVGAMLPPGISEGFADALPAAERSMEKQLGSMTEKLSGVSIPAMVSASMDTSALEMMRAAVDLKTAQTSASAFGDPSGGLPEKIGLLFEKIDALMTRMENFSSDRMVSLEDLREALKGLRVEMDGREVGEVIDERLGELYEQRGKGVV